MDEEKIEKDRKVDSLFDGEEPEKKIVITKTFTFEQIRKWVRRKIMKKLFIVLVMLAGINSFAYAADVAPVAGLFAGNINLQGDTIYIPKYTQFALGVGTVIAQVDKYGIVDIRGEAVTTVGGEIRTLAGVGVGVNIPKLIERFGGTWGLKQFAVDIFAAGMLDMSGKVSLVPVIGLSVIKVNF